MVYSFRLIIAVLTSLTMAMPACGPKRSTNKSDQTKAQTKEKAPTKEQIQQTNIQLNRDRKVLQQTIRDKNAEIEKLNQRIQHGELSRQVQIETQQQLDQYRQIITALRRKVEEMEELRQQIEIVSAELAKSEAERMQWMKRARHLNEVLRKKMRDEREKEEDKELDIEDEPGTQLPGEKTPTGQEKDSDVQTDKDESQGKTSEEKTEQTETGSQSEDDKKAEDETSADKSVVSSTANEQMNFDPPVISETEPAKKAEDEKTKTDVTSSEENDEAPAPVADEEKQLLCQTKEQLEKEITELEAKEKTTQSADDKKSLAGQVETKKAELEQIIEQKLDCSTQTADSNPAEEDVTASSQEPLNSRQPSEIDQTKEAKQKLETLRDQEKAAQTELANAQAELRDSDKKSAAEQAVAAAQKKIDDLKPKIDIAKKELRELLKVDDIAVSIEVLLTKAEQFIAASGKGLSKSRKELQALIQQLQKRKSKLMSEIEKAGESIGSSASLSDSDKKTLIAEFEQLKGEADSVPGTIMARLQSGDLSDKEHPFYIVVYGSVAAAELPKVRELVLQTKHVKVVAGVKNSSQDDLLPLIETGASAEAGVEAGTESSAETSTKTSDKMSSLQAFYHRHLVTAKYDQLMALVSELNGLSKTGAVLVSVKPLERIEVDVLLTWKTKKQADNQAHALIQTEGEDGGLAFSLEEMSLEKLMSAAELIELKEECSQVRKACVEKLLEKGLLKKSSSEANTVAEKAFQSLSEAVNAEGENSLVELSLETRVWAVQIKTMMEDPVQNDLKIKGVTRQQVREGAQIPAQNTGYILEDNKARYYLLPESLGDSKPRSDIGSKEVDVAKKVSDQGQESDMKTLREEISSALQ